MPFLRNVGRLGAVGIIGWAEWVKIHGERFAFAVFRIVQLAGEPESGIIPDAPSSIRCVESDAASTSV